MPEETQSEDAAPGSSGDKNDGSVPISPELVKEIAERVYAMLLEELRVENERTRWHSKTQGYRPGGW